MAIEDHPGFNLVEVDSGYVAAHNASHLEVNSGQRYSFLLRTKPAAELRALNKTAFWANMETRWRPTRDRGAWLLQYDAVELALPPVDTAPQLPAALDPTGPAYAPIPADLNETVPLPDEAPFWVVPALRPLDPAEVPPPDAQVSRRITISMQQLSNGTGATQKVFWNVDRYMVRSPFSPGVLLLRVVRLTAVPHAVLGGRARGAVPRAGVRGPGGAAPGLRGGGGEQRVRHEHERGADPPERDRRHGLPEPRELRGDARGAPVA